MPPYDWQDDPDWDPDGNRVGLLYLAIAATCIALGMILLFSLNAP